MFLESEGKGSLVGKVACGALKGCFTNRQDRKEVPQPEVPQDFEAWEPKKKGGKGPKDRSEGHHGVRY